MSKKIFTIWRNREFEPFFVQFLEATKHSNTNRIILTLIKNYVLNNNTLDIPMIRKTLKNNPEDLERLRRLIKEFE